MRLRRLAAGPAALRRVEPLQRLYAASHGWERLGWRLAEQYLILHQAKAESLLFQSAEERYLGLLA